MAKIRFGPMIGAARGSVASVVFTANPYGPCTRNRTKPTVSTTEAALAAKNRMTTATQAWQELTAAERAPWRGFSASNPVVGSLGDQVILSGHAAYVGINIRRQLLGQGVLTDPPITPAPPGLQFVSVVPNKTAGTADVTFGASPLPAGTVLWFRACQVASQGIDYVTNLLRWCPISAIAPATPYDAFANFESRLGALVIGQEFHLLVSVGELATGLLSTPLRCQATIV